MARGQKSKAKLRRREIWASFHLPSPVPRAPAAPQHPLLNSVVLQNVFQYLPFEKDLRSCRLVHTAWNAEVIPYLKKRCQPITFTDTESLQKFVDCVNDSSGDIPLTRFHLQISPQFQGTGETWTRFLETVAPFTRTLHLDFKPSIPEQPLLYLPDDLRFPELRRIKLEDPRIPEHHQIVVRLVHRAPKLAILNWEDPDAPSLRDLTLHETLHLKHLKLEGIDQDNVDAVYKFLREQRLHLVELEVAYMHLHHHLSPEEETRPPLQFPSVKTLTFYQVLHPFMTPHLFGGEEMVYATYFPNLHHFCLELPHGNLIDFVHPQPLPAPSVEHLSFFRDDLDNGQESLTALLQHGPRLFPNIRVIMVPAEYRDLWRLVERMANLEELGLWAKPGAKLDTIFTGVKAEECRRLRGLSRRLFERETEKYAGILDNGPRASMHRIRALDVFIEEVPVLTDVTCRLVFLRMRMLNSLCFRGKPEDLKQISKSVKKEMRLKFRINI